MHPAIGSYPAIWVLWSSAIVAGAAGALWSARREGIAPRTTAVLVLCLILAFLAGSKLHWWLAHPEEFGAGGVFALLVRGFHFPGGLFATALAMPIACRLAGVRCLAFLDAVAPVAAASMALARIGCFLSGCCFGRACDLPWGLRFPPGSRAYLHHLDTHQLPPGGAATVPLHPTQLYFAAAALAIAALLVWLRPRRRYEGELSLAFVVVWGWSEVVIEAFRDHSVLGDVPYLWYTGAVIAAVSTATWIAVERRSARPPLDAPAP